MADKNLIVCPHCGQSNRAPAGTAASGARCGTCKQPLFDGHAHDVDGRNFQKQIVKSDVPVLVDVWAPWCGPCRMMAPAYEEAARALEPGLRVIKLNSDNEQQIAGQLNIRGIPTMLLMHKGREIARTSGAMQANQIVGWVKQNLPG